MNGEALRFEEFCRFRKFVQMLNCSGKANCLALEKGNSSLHYRNNVMIAFCRDIDHCNSVGTVAEEFVMPVMHEKVSSQAGRGIYREVAGAPRRHRGNEHVR